MNSLPLVTLWGLLLFAVAPVGAQSFEKANEAASRGDFAAAAAELKPLAEGGNADAQYSLANLYRDGRGVPRDDDRAARLYQRAAAGGLSWAAFDLGMLYWSQVLADNGRANISGDDLVRVHMWLGIAAATEKGGCVDVGATLRDAVAQSMSAEQIASAQDSTRAWLAEHPKMDTNVASAKPAC